MLDYSFVYVIGGVRMNQLVNSGAPNSSIGISVLVVQQSQIRCSFRYKTRLSKQYRNRRMNYRNPRTEPTPPLSPRSTEVHAVTGRLTLELETGNWRALLEHTIDTQLSQALWYLVIYGYRYTKNPRRAHTVFILCNITD